MCNFTHPISLFSHPMSLYSSCALFAHTVSLLLILCHFVHPVYPLCILCPFCSSCAPFAHLVPLLLILYPFYSSRVSFFLFTCHLHVYAIMFAVTLHAIYVCLLVRFCYYTCHSGVCRHVLFLPNLIKLYLNTLVFPLSNFAAS